MDRNLCVFCGSSSGGEEFLKLGRELAIEMAKDNWNLVYGGASIGLMAEIANEVLAQNKNVYGVIPKSLMEWEVGHTGLTELKVVDSMHERKQIMYDYSKAFVALPGGFGTLDELCEILTWAQLKYHEKPIFLLNHNGFYDHLIKHFKHINSSGFLKDDHLNLVHTVNSVSELISELSKI